VAQKAFGRFTYEPNSTECTLSTIFDLASVTKVVSTTTMAAILYERGLLDLDMPLSSIVPEFLTDDPRREEVTPPDSPPTKNCFSVPRRKTLS